MLPLERFQGLNFIQPQKTDAPKADLLNALCCPWCLSALQSSVEVALQYSDEVTGHWSVFGI